MFIANLSSSELPSRKANSIQVMQMSEAFCKQGHSVILFGKRSADFEPANYYTADLKKYYGTESSFAIRLINCKLKKRFWSGVEYGLRVYRAIKCVTEKPDVFYGRNLYALISCLAFNKPVIYESHASPSCGRKKIENHLFYHTSFAGLVVISETLADYYRENFEIFRLFPEKILVCNDAGREFSACFKENCDNLHFTIGYAGSLFPGKGVELVAKLAEAMPDFKFVIAGGDDRQIKEKRKYWPYKNLDFKGFIQPSLIGDFCKSCDVLIAPYQEQVFSDEKERRDLSRWMSPLKIFDYMAVKRPMIVSDLPCFEDVLKNHETALLVKPEDLQGWCQAVYALYIDASLRKKLSENAYREFETKYTWKLRAKRIIEYFVTTVGDKISKPVILHVIGDLNMGGAERTLTNLLLELKNQSYEHRVITLFENGTLAERLDNSGIKMFSAHLQKNIFCLFQLGHLIKLIKAQKPVLIQTWMYHSNNLINLLSVFFRGIPIVNNIRHSEPWTGSLKTILSAWVGAVLSRLTNNKILCCSKISKEKHIAIGYPSENMVVIENGFSERTYNKEQARSCFEFLNFLGERKHIRGKNWIVIVVGRYCKEKDYDNFARAAGYVAGRMGNVTFVMCGSMIDSANSELVAMLTANNVIFNCHLMGQRNDVEDLMAVADLLVSASSSEAFPNVIAEAMNVGTPCVATDVGESRNIIGDTGIVVPAKNPVALGEAILTMLKDEDRLVELGKRAKQRIEQNYSVKAMAKHYIEVWKKVDYRF